MGRVKSIHHHLKNHIRQHPAQSFVEFALALPILLLLMFGIIEFGRLMQAWLALENGARFAVRYAITGQYNPQYCEAAGDALGVTTYKDLDYLDGEYDCKIPEKYPTGHASAGQEVPEYELKTIELQDWARLPSIRENAMAGAAGIALDEQASVSGDYISYLTNAYGGSGNILSQTNRGNPTEPGYFSISTCSNHVGIDSGFQLNPNGFWYDDDLTDGLEPVHTDENRYPIYCQEVTVPPAANAVVRYVDHGGGPGDRVRVVLTYRHKLITPFISNWWPTLKLSTQREGIVEKFRTSRVTGLTGGISMAATITYTPSDTFTPSNTPVASDTPSLTPTDTATPTPTKANCPDTGTILREYWEGPTGNGVSNLTNYVDYPYFPNVVEYKTSYLGPTNNADNYGARYRGYICAPYDGWYKFFVVSDDNSDLYLSSDLNPNNMSRIAYVSGWASSDVWSRAFNVYPSEWIYLYAGQEYYTEALHKEGTGGDNFKVGWLGPNDLENESTPQVIPGEYLRPFEPTAMPVIQTCDNAGSLLRQRWTGIGGNRVTDLLNYSQYPGNPVALADDYIYSFADDYAANNFGERIRGYICPPYDGQYRFYVSSNNSSALYLSSNQNVVGPGTVTPVAYLNGYVNVGDYSSNASQSSSVFTLQGGTLYYVEALWKEATGDEHFSVAWTGPFWDSPKGINGEYLVPVTPEPTYTATQTFTPSMTFTPSKTFTPSQTFTPSRTFTPSQTPSHTFTPSRTFTPSQTFSRTPSLTPSKTLTPSQTFTNTFTPSRTNTLTPSNTFTVTNTRTNTATRTFTYTPSKTYTPTPSFTPSKTFTPSPFISPTPSYTITKSGG